jgi:hypothetical protein
VRSIGLASFILFLFFGSLCLHADEIIILELPSSRQFNAHLERADPAISAPKPPRAGSRAPKQSKPSRGGGYRRTATGEYVVGRLGILEQNALIRAGRSSHHRLLAHVAAGTYVALTNQVGDWYGVLMSDRSTGWVHRSYVRILNYEVVSPTPPSTQAAGYIPNLSSPLLTSEQRNLLQYAFSFLGVPYKYGGTSVSGMDCSAFVQRCFAAMGIRLPRTAAEQFRCGLPISPQELQPADRVYFANRNGRIHHTGIYIGNGYFIHSSSSRKGVAVSHLSEPMYARMYVGARR